MIVSRVVTLFFDIISSGVREQKLSAGDLPRQAEICGYAPQCHKQISAKQA